MQCIYHVNGEYKCNSNIERFEETEQTNQEFEENKTTNEPIFFEKFKNELITTNNITLNPTKKIDTTDYVNSRIRNQKER